MKTKAQALFHAVAENKFSYKILTSHPIMLLQVIIGALCFKHNLMNEAIYCFVCLIIISLMTSRDMLPSALPFMLLGMTVLAQYGKFIDDYVSFFPLVGVLFVGLALRWFIWPVKFEVGKLFYGIVFVAISVLIGGMGVVSAEAYFSIVPMYYTFGLSFGIVIAYMYIRNYILNDAQHNPMMTFAKTMTYVCIMGMAMVAPVVLEGFKAGEPWNIQWSNNLSTFMLMALPFPFYLASKKRDTGVFYFAVGLGACAVTMLTLSRGGIIFGMFMLFICVGATTAFTTKINRLLYGFVVFFSMTIVAGVFADNPEISELLSHLLRIDGEESRVHMFKLAIDNYNNYPMFGTGLAYVGEFYDPAKGAMYFYHSKPFQIIASLGTFGVFAYTYQAYTRLKVCFNKKAKRNVFIFCAVLGFELMSLVNPGEFCPVPYVIMITLILVIGEVMNKAPRVEFDEELLIENSKAYPIFSYISYQNKPKWIQAFY